MNKAKKYYVDKDGNMIGYTRYFKLEKTEKPVEMFHAKLRIKQVGWLNSGFYFILEDENNKEYYMNTKRQKEVFDEFIKTNPMILCRTNKQVKAIQEFGYTNVSTVHQAKGLEYDNVIVVDTTIRNMEDLNIAYVALTRARDNMLVVNWSNLEQMWLQEKSKPSGFGWNF